MESFSAYQQTIDYLFSRLPMFSRLGKDAIKKDLTNIRKLCDALGNPQERFRSIHIAGTNGKGSTSHMLSAVLQQHGYKTGLYTSPHLIDFRERIRINGQMISREWVVQFTERIRPAIEAIEPSFFEITVAMAFAAFAEMQVDVAVIETGLGGRLDSTNVIIPELSVITNISYDHQDMLGNTLGEIAREKAGIIKPGVPVIIGEQQEETERVFFEVGIANQSTLYYAEALWDLVGVKKEPHTQHYKAINRARREIFDLHTDLTGRYQYHNIKTVLTAIEVLMARGWNLDFDTSLKALASVKQLTGLRGRWELLQQHPLIIADVGHNPAGMREIVGQWEQVATGTRHFVIGFVKDKEIGEALALLPTDGVYHFCNAAIPRALPAEELRAAALAYGLQGTAHPSVADAVQQAREQMQDNDSLLITGSFFIVGEALEYLEQKQEAAKEPAGS